MREPQNPEADAQGRVRLRATLGLVLAGAALSAFLSAAGHSGWFELRPASMGAAAMAEAAGPPAAADRG
ncbi:MULTISPECIES: hypothetical protein [Novosphingobium]|uniref:hypothetical protein n=1 Tax=Novosphingobium TaxID=165696 RepID=UPI000D6DE8B8|nr:MULTISPECIES: hypothetical protein [Novosphingobium]